jgi:type II secretory pathway pseudopilin PulG
MSAAEAPSARAPSVRRRIERGVSHIEVLIAMLIVGLATPFLLGGITGSLTQAGRSYERGAAAAWVQGQIEALRRGCYESLGASQRKITPSTVLTGEPVLPDGFGAGAVRIEDAGPALRRISVAIYRRDWATAAPPERPVLETTTFVADLKVAGACP